MITKLKIYILDIVIFLGLMFSSAGNAFGAKSMDAGQTQTKSLENFDFFPDYHREAKENSEVRQAMNIQEEIKIKEDGAILAGVKWLGKMIPYEFLYIDYSGYIDRVSR